MDIFEQFICATESVNDKSNKAIKKELRKNKIYFKDIKKGIYELEIIGQPFITGFRVRKQGKIILKNNNI